MFKNTTRRSWSLAAVVSLGISALTGLPAQANTNVLVAPAAGTSYATLVDQTFIIQAGVGAGIPTSNLTSLKWKVEKAAGFTVSATASNTTTLTADTEIASASTSYVVTPLATSGAVHGLALKVTGANEATASKTVTVTAWLDTLANNTVDAGESSTTVTVSFVKYSEVAPTVTLTQPIQGDTRVTASASVAGINLQQLTAANFKIQFSVGGTAIAGPSTFTSGGAAVGTASPAALARNATVSAQVEYGTGKFLGSATTLTVTNATIQDVTASGVVSANALANGTFRMNTAFAVKAQTATSSSATAVPGVPVRFVFSGLTGSERISVDGGAFTSSDVTVTATSDATGYAYVPVATSGFDAGGQFDVAVSAQNQSGSLTFTAAAPTFSSTVSGSLYRYATPGSTVALTFNVADQFDVASTRTNQTVEVTYIDGASARNTYSAAVSGGVAVVNVPVGTATGSATAVARLLTQDINTLNSSAGADNGAIAFVVTSSSVVFDGTAPRTFPATKSAAVGGTVTYSGSVSIPGATVTVTGQGLVFTNAAGATFSDAISFLTGADGNFDFTVSGTVSGDYEVRATVDSAVMTSSFTVNAAAYNTGANVTISGPDSSLQGKTVIYTVLVTDRYGNPVETEGTTGSVTVTFTGPGNYSGTLPTKTDEDGELTVSLQTASNDEGTIALSVTYNKEGASTAAADKVTAVKLTTVAKPVVVLAGSVDLAGAASAIDGSISTYTATVVDADGAALAGRTVTFTAAGVLGGLTLTSVVTDANGVATTRFVSTAGSRGTLVVTAVVDGKSDDLLVAVVEDPAEVAARAAAEAAAKEAAEKAAAAEAAAKVGTVAVAAASSAVLTGSLTDVTITLTEVSGKAAAGRTVLLSSVGVAYLSAQTVTTDAQGKAVVKLIAGAAAGNTVITAVSEGVSANATVAVSAPAVAEVNAVIGTYNGRVAVRVENAKGSAVSVKIGNRWFKYSSLNDNYLWSVRSTVGATVPVAVYVDGQLQNVATITVK